jgi:hypothetical protein
MDVSLSSLPNWRNLMNFLTRFSASAVLALLALCGLFSVRVEAQSTFGSVRGSTMDQTGAALPGAQVTLHNLDQNADTMAVSDAEGDFLFENLKPGHYKLTAVKEGFANGVVDQIELAARQDLRLDVKLARKTRR